jgi:DNA-binding GntR family transcriptional regulator
MRSEVLTIVRDNISDSVANELRNMIVDGRLPAGERINEVHLSQQLGVSRTPLREALARLAQEGALRQVPRIGYFVRPLTLEEFEQIYAIRPLLDPEALRLAGLPSSDRMERLRAINDTIHRESDADRIIDLDDDWHLELIADCPNKVLIDLIRQFIQRTRRYEIALMREHRNVLVAIANHDTIMAALRRGDLEAACAALRTNLQTGRAPIVEWLTEREMKGTQGKETP